MGIPYKNPSLLWRIFSFAVLFVAISGVLGPRIINHSLVGQFGFVVYGGSGKALVFALIAFCMLTYRKRLKLKLEPWTYKNVLWLLLSAGGFLLAWLAITQLQHGAAGVLWPVLAHIGIVVTVAAAFLAALGWATLQEFWSKYRKELLWSLGIGVGFFVFLEAVYAAWSVLSTGVLHVVYWLLQVSGLPTATVPPYVLVLGDFGVEISKYCSGIESIALFTGFYIIVGLLDWQRLDHRKYVLLFLPGLMLVLACNVVRIYLLMLVGYYINPNLALQLFHTYAGMVFFIIATGIFWLISYKWMLRPKQTSAQ